MPKKSSRKIKVSNSYPDENLIGICVIQNGRILEANDRLADLLDYNHADGLNAKVFLDLVDPNDRARLAVNIDLENKQSRLWAPSIIRLIRRDNKTILVNASFIRSVYLGGVALVGHIFKVLGEMSGNLEVNSIEKSEEDATIKKLSAQSSEEEPAIKLCTACRSYAERLIYLQNYELMARLNELLDSEAKDREKIELSLTREKNLSEALINSLPGIFYVFDKNGLLKRWNKNFEVISGYSPEELLNMHFTNFQTGNEKEMAAVAVRDAFAKGEAFVEVNFVTKLQKRIPYYFTGTRITIDGSDHMIGVGVDIAEKKILEAETMRAAHLASIGELAAGVAHEINNPIQGIISCAQIMLDQFEVKNHDTQIPKMVIKEGKRIAAIVQNLLSFSRHQKETIPVAVEEIINDSISLTRTRMAKDGIKLTTHLPSDLPQIMGNAREIQQVFLNIINNAVYALNAKYSGHDQNKILEIKAEVINMDSHRGVRITFLDSGIGIPADIVNNVCDPFFSTKPRGEGSGLGLSISSRIIKDHGGRLIFESVEGEHTKATIDLPVYERTDN